MIYLSKKKKKKSAKALVFITWSPSGTLCILPVCMCCTPFCWVLLLIKYFLLIKKNVIDILIIFMSIFEIFILIHFYSFK